MTRWYPDKVAANAANSMTVEMVRASGARDVAELGVYQGATTLALAEVLRERDGWLYLFDYAERLMDVQKRLDEIGFANYMLFPNSTALMDSYCWSLATVLDEHRQPFLDYVFIDGAHTWHTDGFAFLLIDRLLRPGGHVDFDDYAWTIGQSRAFAPENFPEVESMFSPAQIDVPQVAMIVTLLVRTDPRYIEVMENKVFRKVSDAAEGWFGQQGDLQQHPQTRAGGLS